MLNFTIYQCKPVITKKTIITITKKPTVVVYLCIISFFFTQQLRDWICKKWKKLMNVTTKETKNISVCI